METSSWLSAMISFICRIKLSGHFLGFFFGGGGSTEMVFMGFPLLPEKSGSALPGWWGCVRELCAGYLI